SLEAAEARDDLVRVMSRSARIVPHLHLCLQSGSDRILKRMKRRYTTAGFLERCRRIKESLDQPAPTTDGIVGFPGETDDDLAATCAIVERVGFCKVHVFSFSPREGTPAAEFPDRVSPSVIAERRRRLVALSSRTADAFARSLFGRVLGVIVEGPDMA